MMSGVQQIDRPTPDAPAGAARESVTDVERELGLLLRRARAAAAVVASQVHPDLEPSAYPLLQRTFQVPGVRAADLATYVGVGKATISRQLRRLEDLGLIARRPDPQDSRGHLIELTPEGERQVRAAQDGRRLWLGRALSSWTAAELDTLAASLAHLNAAIDETRGL